MNILVAIAALSILILVHETGHFVTAKLLGIKVLEFSIFMGPKLFSVRRGETRYSIRLIPIGGYVKMEGEEEKSDDERAFNKKPIWARAIVIFAGAFMNIAMAILILVIVFSARGYSIPTLDKVLTGSPAMEAGFRPGDRILRIDGKKIYHPMDVQLMLYTSNGKPLDVMYKREKKEYEASVVPKKTPPRYRLGFSVALKDGVPTNIVQKVESGTPAEKAGLISGDKIYRLNNTEVSSNLEIQQFLQKNKQNPVDIYVERNSIRFVINDVKPMIDTSYVQYYAGFIFKEAKGGVLSTIQNAVNYSISTMRSVLYSLIWLIKGKVSFGEVSGPIGIVSTIGDVVKFSPTVYDKIINLLGFVAFLSLNLGVINLIPFPALDGSKLVILLVEGIRRKPIPPEKEAFISMIGFVCLIILMMFTFYNDIIKLTQ